MKYLRGYGRLARYGRSIVGAVGAALAGRLSRAKRKSKGSGHVYNKRLKTKRGIKRRYRKRFKSKSKSSIEQAISQHSNVNAKFLRPLTLSYRSLPHKYTFKFQVMKQRTQNWSQGEQNVIACFPVGTTDQFIGATSTTRSSEGKWDTDPFLLNPWSTIPVNGVYPGPMGAVVAADKIYYHGYKQHLSLLNMETVAVDLTVMWFLCKKNANRNVIDAWNEAASVEEKLTQPNPVVAGTLASTTATSGFSSSPVYGANPMEYKTFKQFWKLLDTYNCTLQSGDQINIHRDIKFNKFFSRNYFNDMPTTYIAGFTVYPIVIARGNLVGVTTALGVAASEVAYAPTKIGLVDNQEHRFGGVPVGANIHTSRVYQGMVINDTADFLVQIDDVDNVVKIEQE